MKDNREKREKAIGFGGMIGVGIGALKGASSDYFEIWLLIGMTIGMMVGGLYLVLKEIWEDE